MTNTIKEAKLQNKIEANEWEIHNQIACAIESAAAFCTNVQDKPGLQHALDELDTLVQALKHDLAEARRLDSRNAGLKEALKILKA